MERKIVQLTAIEDLDGMSISLYAVAHDGTAWVRRIYRHISSAERSPKWEEVPRLPDISDSSA